MNAFHKPIGRFAGALVPVALALVIPATAFGQATRTWVSGVGDDANPCSRTAPCKTFPGAISKTAAGGEINVLDPGGFGAVTITKSITISSVGFEAGVLVSGTNGIVINAGTGDRVILRGLDIEGLGNSPDGVKVVQAGNVRIENSTIDDFTQNGIEVDPNASTAKVEVNNTQVYNGAGNGFIADPTGTGKVKATLINDQFENNNCGVVAASFGWSNVHPNCGATTGSGAGANVQVTAFGTTVADNATTSNALGPPVVPGSSGFFAEGGGSTIRIGSDNIVGNVNGVQTSDAGTITSFGNNQNIGNTINGTPTAPGASTTSLRSGKHHRLHGRKQKKTKMRDR